MAGKSSGLSRSSLFSRIGLGAAALIVAVLLIAWINGGEEALHPIVVPVETPRGAK